MSQDFRDASGSGCRRGARRETTQIGATARRASKQAGLRAARLWFESPVRSEWCSIGNTTIHDASAKIQASEGSFPVRILSQMGQ